MPMNFQQIKAHVSAVLQLDGTAGSEDDTTLSEATNLLLRRMWQRHPWPERKFTTKVTTVAPYTDGTVTLTSGSATVTGSGTTFTAGMVGRKFALALNAPVYRVLAYVSATQITLDRVYLEADASGATYVIYQDEHDALSTIDAIEGAHLILNGVQGPVVTVAQPVLDDVATVQTSFGPPAVVSTAEETTSGTTRVRFSPVPDTKYAVVLDCWRSWTNLSAPGDIPAFHENREPFVVEACILAGQRLSDTRQVTTDAMVESLFSRAWQDGQRLPAVRYQRRTFDALPTRPFVYWQVP